MFDVGSVDVMLMIGGDIGVCAFTYKVMLVVSIYEILAEVSVGFGKSFFSEKNGNGIEKGGI
jgi:hypothetical protein